MNLTMEETTTLRSQDFLRLKRALQALQSARLNKTYADLKQDPQYARIGSFFFEKLYAPEDFSFRDTSIKKLHKLLSGKVYRGMVAAVGQVIELHELTDRLDDRMVEQMIAIGIEDTMTMDQYRAVYRSLDNYDQRIYQIELSLETTRAFHRLSHKWVVAISLNTVRSAAHLIGMGKIIDFVYEGYEGFRSIKNIEYFAEIVGYRERAWHDDIWFAEKGAPAQPVIAKNP
jgi:hypothetical protein